MLQINLLPDSHRRAGAGSAEQLHRLPILWILLAFFIALGLVPALLVQLRNHQLARFKERIQTLEPKRAAVDQVERLLQRLREQEVAFTGLSRGAEYYWSKHLNTLSDVTPEGVWFSEFRLDREKGLIIRGSAIGEGGAEMMRVGRLVQELKADRGFSGAVRDIQIESIKRVQEKEIEVVRFTLACVLAERLTR